MRIHYSLAALAIVSIVGCSGGGDGSGSNSPGSSDQTLVPDLSLAPSVDEYPDNEDLLAVDGIPEIDQARVLIAGEWQATDDASQCITTYQFDQFGVFATSALDQSASGFYEMRAPDGGIELSLDYESENFQSDCFGDINDSDALDPSVSYAFFVNFPDQNSMIFSLAASGAIEIHRFARQ